MDNLRVAFVVGTLGVGGAEKQLFYMARSLIESEIQVRIFCLTKNEHYELKLNEIGIFPIWIGEKENPLWRLWKLVIELYDFKPHIIQSSHFYTNLYASSVAKLYKLTDIGCLRSDAISEVKENGFWGLKLLKNPHALIANSRIAMRNAIKLGAIKKHVFFLPNVIDLPSFDLDFSDSSSIIPCFTKKPPNVIVTSVGRLIPEKRFDRFLIALHKAHKVNHKVRGLIVGDGPERIKLEKLAKELCLLPEGVSFVGQSNQIPLILKISDFFVLTSDFEGFPNVILEAMAASLPVICTPAGDAGVVVQDGITGYVVPFDEDGELAARIVKLAVSPQLCEEMGRAGRSRVERFYSYNLLSKNLISIYRVLLGSGGLSPHRDAKK
jgi:glycosyltransferase involved in cell wall biosynthesis